MAYLFDTDAISEVLKPRPAREFVAWLKEIPREEQHTSAVCIGELYKGAFRSVRRDWHLEKIDERVLPSLTVLPFDVRVARRYGEIRAALEQRGQPLDEADLQIAATALTHGLELVTGNLRHFSRVPDLHINMVFADTRSR